MGEKISIKDERLWSRPSPRPACSRPWAEGPRSCLPGDRRHARRAKSVPASYQGRLKSQRWGALNSFSETYWQKAATVSDGFAHTSQRKLCVRVCPCVCVCPPSCAALETFPGWNSPPFPPKKQGAIPRWLCLPKQVPFPLKARLSPAAGAAPCDTGQKPPSESLSGPRAQRLQAAFLAGSTHTWLGPAAPWKSAAGGARGELRPASALPLAPAGARTGAPPAPRACPESLNPHLVHRSPTLHRLGPRAPRAGDAPLEGAGGRFPGTTRAARDSLRLWFPAHYTRRAPSPAVPAVAGCQRNFPEAPDPVAPCWEGVGGPGRRGAEGARKGRVQFPPATPPPPSLGRSLPPPQCS